MLITIVNLAILQPALAVAMQGALPVGGELAGVCEAPCGTDDVSG